MEMTFDHVCNPCEYLVFDNVCLQDELNKCFMEAKLLEPSFKEPKQTGSAKTNTGELKKQNSGIFLKEIYTPNFALYSPIATALHRIVEIIKNRQYTALSQLNYIKQVSGYDVLLNAYKNEDYYRSHQDVSVLTILFWFGESNNEGGDLVFTSFNHTIPFVSNRVIVFPSHYEYEITKVKTDSKDYVRYSATAFLMIDGRITAEQPITVGTNDF